MILAVLVNGRTTLVVNANQLSGTVIIDGRTHNYDNRDILTQAAEIAQRGYAATVVIPNSSVREYCAALLLLGVRVKPNLLASLALSPLRLTGQVARIEPLRQQIQTVQGLMIFLRRLFDSTTVVDLQSITAGTLVAPVSRSLPPAQA